MIKTTTALNKNTTYRFGGICNDFYTLNEKSEIDKIHNLNFNNEYFILGKGSNVVFSDNKYEGIVIQNKMENIDSEFTNDSINVDAGVYLPNLSRYLKDSERTGGEYLLGIPGTVGGAIKMNAGCYGYEFMDSVNFITYFDTVDKKIKNINRKNIKYSYRNTEIKNAIILSANLSFSKEDPIKINDKMIEFTQHRKNTQPSAIYNAGSVFKNGSNYFAAELIEKAGLKGYEIDGVKVSEKHSNFLCSFKKRQSIIFI
ncbi:MAG: UDP-N-acetylmuramate dehydrogenase [Candidatus Actinomarina sp.]